MFKNYSTLPGNKAPGKFVDVGSHTIHYELIGHGETHLFLLPGGMGSSRTDWSPQLQTLNKSKFTILAWDPPGFGYSSGPNHCDFVDLSQRDAEVAGKLLKTLGVTKTNVVGWCAGGPTAIALTAQNPNIVEKLVVMAAVPHMNMELLKRFKSIRNINAWTPEIRDPLVDLHGAEFVQKTWDKCLETFARMQKTNDGEIIKNECQQITCPTLVIHSLDDSWVPISQSHYIVNNIKNSKLIQFETGNHYPHFVHVERFNKIIENFITL